MSPRPLTIAASLAATPLLAASLLTAAPIAASTTLSAPEAAGATATTRMVTTTAPRITLQAQSARGAATVVDPDKRVRVAAERLGALIKANRSTTNKAGAKQAPTSLTYGQTAVARRSTFRVNYSGFTPQARAAFQRAVDYLSTKFTSRVPIVINAKFTPLGTNVLGRAGSNKWRANFPGAQYSNTFYADAAADKRAGRDLGPGAPDIIAEFSSNRTNWHYGTGAAPAGKFDFQSVVLHEVAHGMGFIGSGRIENGRGSVTWSGWPIVYDRFVEMQSGALLWKYPDKSTAIANALRSNWVYFDSPQLNAVNPTRLRLWAPAKFEPGSSYSHLDEKTYPKGNASSLMTPGIQPGETIRSASEAIMSVYRTVGWG